MISERPELHEMTEELQVLLDEEIRLLHLRTRQFEELYDAILHRDNDRMETLLVEMTDAQAAQAEVDTKLQAVRAIFAKALACQPEEMKLSMLIDGLEAKPAGRLEYKRQQIIQLAEKLKKKHLDTAILLSESARLNRTLMEGLLPGNETVTTYNHIGANGWRDGSGLVDTEM